MAGKPRPWPWSGDTGEDKARRIAGFYRGLVQRIAQGQCADPAGDLHRLDRELEELGIHWHLPVIVPAEPDDWLPAADIAHYIQRNPRDIYNWARRGHIIQRTAADGSPEYLLRSVLEYGARRHQNHTKKAGR